MRCGGVGWTHATCPLNHAAFTRPGTDTRPPGRAGRTDGPRRWRGPPGVLRVERVEQVDQRGITPPRPPG
ncbi:hypothetical protein SERN_0096 [Serinibacter arcticus]|uniref:Uncharacterized protein n=1 Tax=Serinibacter arcticus TaxID=1655435 RepID=A0A4Z1E1R3_9MICO|nr:hypothetical protein SERN_0096 [Serinibacter arcticus]